MSKITPKVDGPLLAQDVPNLRDHEGNAIEARETYGLCRCGLSSKKPFCDGSHKNAGWESANTTDLKLNKIFSYVGDVEGQQVKISFNPALCGHVAECGRLHKAVFNTKQQPWVQPENGTVEGIKAVIKGCPSGALRAGWNGEEPVHDQEAEPEITVMENGPLKVTNIALDGEFNGVEANPNGYLLCRCGASKNKPFCDGSHHEIKFKG